MILLDNTLISEDIIEKEFVCNLNKCKGSCCVEGEFGAPLEQHEIDAIESNLHHIKPYITAQSVKSVAQKGVCEKDSDGDWVTTCLPSGECNFSYRNDNGILSCGIEKSWREGKSSIRKPSSCHLYPIRLSKVGEYTALNYHRWEICKPACKLGKENQVAVYRFLKDALIERFGEEWYNTLDELAQEWLKSK